MPDTAGQPAVPNPWFTQHFMLEHILEQLRYQPDNPLLFNSGLFLILFTVFLGIYALIYTHKPARTVFVLAFSLYFYYKASGIYVLILIVTVVVDFYLALFISRSRDPVTRKILLVVAILFSLSFLVYFKYTNFLLGNLYALTGQPFEPLDIFLPIGISFYTFQTLSYVVDVYWGKIQPNHSLADYAFYLTYFPQLVAGPIVRASDFLPQVYRQIRLDHVEIYIGLVLVMRGLIKKAILADYVAQYNDIVYGNPAGYSGFENLMAVYGYTLQIYCDFSGYSDMAIGFAQIMGFRLCENFNAPYRALNITDFWRRWHISLSTWLRDYVYIPQGGNRRGEFNRYLFLMSTMLIGGLWHGASWKFVFWGGMHGLGLVVHKLWGKFVGKVQHPAWTVLSWLVTFHFVAMLWIFFRATDFQSAVLTIQKSVTDLDLAYILPFWETRPLFCVLLLVGFLIHFIPNTYKNYLTLWFVKMPLILKVIVVVAIFQAIIQIQGENVQPFIYFQF